MQGILNGSNWYFKDEYDICVEKCLTWWQGHARELSLHIKHIPDGKEKKGKHAENEQVFFSSFF